jgi:hypothetical protein
MTRRNSIDQLAAATVRQAQSEMAAMQRDLNKLRDSVSGLTRGIAAPVIRPPHTRSKRTTNTSLAGEFLDLVAEGVMGQSGFGGSASVSLSQKAGSTLAMLALGQRIR